MYPPTIGEEELDLMKKEFSTPVVVIVIIIVIAIAAAIGWKYVMGGGNGNVTPQQQIKMMQHMKPPNTGKP